MASISSWKSFEFAINKSVQVCGDPNHTPLCKDNGKDSGLILIFITDAVLTTKMSKNTKS